MEETALFTAQEMGDDRTDIQTGDQVLLIVEDDPTFAKIMLDRAREKGFKGIIATAGEQVSPLARRFRPDAITLDIRLPDMDGWTVLDRLKHDPNTRHIPVHIITATEEKQRGLRQGAMAFMTKPVTKEGLDEALGHIQEFTARKQKRLLVVEDDDVQRNAIVELIGNGDVKTTAVSTGAEALLGLPDMKGAQLIQKIRKEVGTGLPIIVYTARELTKKEETELRRLTDTIIIKDVQSPERLLDETTLFLHRVQANLPAPQRQMLEQVRLADPVLAGRKVLVVDDDVRNIFALTSLLERHQMQVLYAENGKDGIELLENTAGIDVVLMDVMMPEMDGYETMRTIRGIDQFKSLPIVALTAKAMKGDRDKCIEAGASDYIAKPVDSEQLLSLLRVWLYR
jgi:CheY-like chemotaxis protein